MLRSSAASTSASTMVRVFIAMVSMATMAHSKYSLDFSEHYGFTHRKE